MAEYPFKDLLPLEEVLEREGYYTDWTHLDPEVFYSLTQISEYIKTKGYGVDVRLLIAQLAEHFGLKSTQIIDLANLLQQQFTDLEGVTQSFTNNINSLVAQMEAEKDAVIANATVDSEVILARGGKPTLGARLDETTTQLAQKANVAYVNDIIGNLTSGTPTDFYESVTALNSAHPNGSDTPKLVGIDGITHVYVYNGSEWKDAGVYQQNVLQPQSVNYKHIELQTQHTQVASTHPFTLEVGTISGATGEDSTVVTSSRVRSSMIKVDKGDVISLDSDDYNISVYHYDSNKDMTFVNLAFTSMVILEDEYIRLVVRPMPDDTIEIVQNIPQLYDMITIKRSRWNDLLSEFINTNNYNPRTIVETGKNLFNKYDLHVGYIKANGIISVVDTYRTNKQLIPVKAGTSYAITHPRKITLYNNSLVPIDHVDVTSSNDTIYTPASDGLLQFSVSTGSVDSTQMEEGTTFTSVEPYYDKLKYGLIGDDVEDNGKLTGKSLLNLGDSIASPSSVNNQQAYAHIITQRHGMTLYSKSVGGATMGDNSGARSFILQQFRDFRTENPDVTPDYILVNGMTNDILYSPVGDVTTGHTDIMDTLTFCGGFEELIRTMKTELPSSKILYVFAHKMNTRDYDKQLDYHNKGVQILKKWSVPFVDLLEEGGLNTILEEMRIFTDAGTHPNELGYRTYYVPPIEAKLLTI